VLPMVDIGLGAAGETHERDARRAHGRFDERLREIVPGPHVGPENVGRHARVHRAGLDDDLRLRRRTNPLRSRAGRRPV